MENLENYGVLELNASKVKETQGGSILAFLGAIATIITIVVTVDAAAEEFMKGWNNPR